RPGWKQSATVDRLVTIFADRPAAVPAALIRSLFVSYDGPPAQGLTRRSCLTRSSRESASAGSGAMAEVPDGPVTGSCDNDTTPSGVHARHSNGRRLGQGSVHAQIRSMLVSWRIAPRR